ncbi:MAG: hypothetical protein KF849_15315 [Rhizobiaceae bacterium]|nr:hypothetical protein [Rhizobiaceae bacterium]
MAIAPSETLGEELTDAQLLASYARTHWHRDLGGAQSDEQIGRVLLTRYSAGPRHWTGVRILRSLGLLALGSERLQ